MKPASVLLADPPWKLSDSLGRRGADAHYQTMTVEQLCAYEYELPPLADDCLLALWRLSSMQPEALRVVSAWGFTVKAELVWLKLTKTGKRWFGMGRYVRNGHETCLLATRGRVQVRDRSVRSVFDAPVLEHSRKPDAFYELLERLAPKGPRVELFARRKRKGWHAIGNDLGADARQMWLPHTLQSARVGA